MRSRTVAVLAVVLWLVPDGEALAADEAAWMFDPGHVAEIALTIPPQSREELAADPDEYVRATFSIQRDDGTTYGPLVVGLRLKGSFSFRTLAGKAAFKLKFNEFVAGQKFLGLKKLTLNNMVQDRTMLHEVLAYEAFRTAGLAALRAGYAYVRVDGDDYGVYLNLETPDSVALERWYASTQHLYEGEVGVDLKTADIARYEVQEGDEDDRRDLAALVAAVDGWTGIDAVADLAQLTRFWAVEHYIGHWDGYSVSDYTNNYYLHSDADGRFTMLPWGTDQTWVRRVPYVGDGGDGAGVAFRRCLADAACAALYRDAVIDVSETLAATDLDGLAVDTAELLEPWQVMDPRRESTMAELRQGLVNLRAFLAVRPSDTPWSKPDAQARPPVGSSTAAAPPVPLLGPLDVGVPDTGPLGALTGRPSAAPSRAPSPLTVGAVTIERGVLVAAVGVPGAGRLSTRATARLGGARRTLCRRGRAVAAPGVVRTWCPLSRAVRRSLRAAHVRIGVRARFVPGSGPPLTASRSLLARR